MARCLGATPILLKPNLFKHQQQRKVALPCDVGHELSN
jgi:hypothetical protein